jgi:branched-subunit amino acid ABC-type transport system permease component
MVFGLMGVMNFGHGALLPWAHTATLVLLRLGDWLQADAVDLACGGTGAGALAALRWRHWAGHLSG